MPIIRPLGNLLAKTVGHSIRKQLKTTTYHLNSTKSILTRRLSSSESRSISESQDQVPVTPLKSDETKAVDDDESDTELNDREFYEHQVEDFESIYKDDPSGTMRAKIEIILQEYEYHKYNSMGRVPSKLDLTDITRFFEEGPTPHTREKLFHFLFKREMAKRAAKRKRDQDRLERAGIRAVRVEELSKIHGGKRTGLIAPDGHLIYGLWHNSLFCRIPENKLRAGSSSKLIGAALHGRKLIYDFDFEDQMDPWIYRNVLEQVQDAYGINKHQYEEPMDLWFCNFNKETKGNQSMLKKSFLNLFDGSMISVKNDCFTNYFDRSRLVYLTPDARERLGEVHRSDDIYIIGVYNDKGSVRPLTYRKANKLGIRTRSLPLDSYLAWRGGSKSLCVNHVTGILLEAIANGSNWREAFVKHIPQRKIKPIDMVIEEEERRRSKLRLKPAKKKFSIRDDLDLL